MEIIFKPTSSLSFATAKENFTKFSELLAKDDAKIIRLDLTEVTDCDSAGLALLVSVKSLCQKRAIELCLDGDNPSLFALAEFCGLQAILPRSSV